MSKFSLFLTLAAAVSANVALAEAPAYVLAPANGETVTEISKVLLEFPETKNVQYFENSTMPIAVLTNGLEGDDEVAYTCQEPTRNTFAESDGIVYEFVFVDEENEAIKVTENGEWTLTIRGFYTTDANDEYVEDIPVITAVYTVENVTTYPVVFQLNPASGASVDQIEKVVLEFPETKNVEYYVNSPMPLAVLTNGLEGDDEIVYTCQEPTRNTFAESDGVVYEFVFVNEDDEAVTITENGVWFLTIRGFYTTDENDEFVEDIPVINADFLVGGTPEASVKYVLTPANGATVAQIETVAVEFPDTKNVEYYENSTMPIAVLTNGLEGDDEVAYTCMEPTRNTFAESDGIVYSFNFVNEEDEAVVVTEPGIWYLTIRGFYTTDENDEYVLDVPVINATFYVDPDAGVFKLNSENGVYNVYGINGVQVIKRGDAESLRSLPAGIYVVNGKKVVVR